MVGCEFREAVVCRCFSKKMFLKFFYNIHRKISVLESLFNKAARPEGQQLY